MDDDKKAIEFNALRLSLASPEQIHAWSHGEVIKPETVNYRTQKPEKDGLFCERIFGPSKDWECYCGKYKKIRYKGIVCDKCGVEVTRSLVRRERMGHIDLATPVSHIWFLRGVPSRIGLVLDLPPQALEKVMYFANFIITNVNEDLKKETLEQIRREYKAKKQKIDGDFDQQLSAFKNRIHQEHKSAPAVEVEALILTETKRLQEAQQEKLLELDEILDVAEAELKEIKVLKIISEHTYQDLSLKYGHIFEAGIGAEAIRQLLTEVNLEKILNELRSALDGSAGAQREKNIKRLRLVDSLYKNHIRPEWMILNTIPVIPPDLRPMVPLDGGRFATSDLNDLYRRIINRNNRLKQLVELNAPEVICRNEKRMLQEAVDALIDNSARHGKTVMASTGQRRMLKSLADILKGKQGRFRQNLLGKRIDYSGRSVIVVGPKLKLDQCGLPKRMALELFKPFIISRLIRQELVHNVRSANRFIESGRAEVWDILEDIIKGARVMLNRAPTLHRLGIQAFKPILIEGKAIQVHPLVCEAYNADFDGDQMAVHVPLTEEAWQEADSLMLASKNLLKPATGEPVVKPTKDIVWGSFYMTLIKENTGGTPKVFASPEDAVMAYHLDGIKIQELIKVRPDAWLQAKTGTAALVETSAGRLLFNQILPVAYRFINQTTDAKILRQIVSECLETYPSEEVAALLDAMKNLGLKYLTRSGYSWGMDDIPAIPEKAQFIKEGEGEVEGITEQYQSGLLTDSERRVKVIQVWTKVKDRIVEVGRRGLDPYGPVYTMVESGSRGSWGQLIQIVGMKGLVTNPAGEIIELPVKGNFKEGFDVLEYFISTHGARKGLSDTALRTANAGYLTRRLIDVCQDVVIYDEDCGDTTGLTISKRFSESIGLNLIDRVKGRYTLGPIIDPATKKEVVADGTLIDSDMARMLAKLDIPEIKIRSVISCTAVRGVCKKCYGWDLAYNKIVKMGTAVGIIAAQSIGEPGTQLTMRTFHTGGVAGLDITQGLPRVEEIFEARPPKNQAFVTEVAGQIKIEEGDKKSAGFKIVKVMHEDDSEDSYPFAAPGASAKVKKIKPEVLVKDGASVGKGDTLFVNTAGEKILVERDGIVVIEKDRVAVRMREIKAEAYQIPAEFHVTVTDGDLVAKGDSLTDGSLDLKQLFRLKGKEVVQRYIVNEIQSIYASQGQKLNDRHIELIARQMFSRVLVTDPGDSNLMIGERLEHLEVDRQNAVLKAEGQRLIQVDSLLLGITKISLSTSSFLSAASFQETARVLINAAVEGKIDRLEGLKENVIIGRLIPAGTGYDARQALLHKS